MVASNPRLCGTGQVAAAHRSRRRSRADRRADRRRRSRDDGRRRALQRRARRADHRHQHGLPGEEGVQRRGRLGAARRTSRWSRAIVAAVVRAVDVPVTLKIRTGPHPARATRCAIARIAEDAGIAALAVHGRTRACAFVGAVEYDTIAAVKRAVRIPVIANGDIDTPETRAGGARAHRRRRADDRPRGAGPAVDLPRDRAFPRHRRRICRRRRSPRRAR